MGQKKYLNIDKLKLLAALSKLSREVSNLKIEVGSKHTIKLSHPNARRSYPVPVGHSKKLASWVVEGVMTWLKDCGACTEKRFDEILKIKN